MSNDMCLHVRVFANRFPYNNNLTGSLFIVSTLTCQRDRFFNFFFEKNLHIGSLHKNPTYFLFCNKECMSLSLALSKTNLWLDDQKL